MTTDKLLHFFVHSFSYLHINYIANFTSLFYRVDLNFLINYFIYFSPLATLGVHCLVGTFSSFHKWGRLFIAVRCLLIAVASSVSEHRLSGRGLR